MKLVDKNAVKYWQQYRKSILESTFVDLSETSAEKEARIKRLENDDEEWFRYYFPNFYYSEPAAFHKRATQRWMKNDRWYEVRAWSRELAKSARAMMEDLKLLVTGKSKYKILISNSYDNAVRLVKPYKIQLESNQRLINDYGKQVNPGDWNEGDFTTLSGFCIMALGAGQSPRGRRKGEVRPDILDFDDIDTDEECRNPEIIKNKWNWIEQAAIPTVSVSNKIRIRFNGNIIAKDCCITRAMQKADYADIVNIRDKNGKSTWKAKNSEKDIDYILSKISYLSAQKEYFNNPISEGSVFKEMHYKKLPPVTAYKYLLCYIDLSYKSSAKNDFKAAVLMGKWKVEYHIHKAFVRQCTTRELVAGLIEIKKYVGPDVPLYFYAEEVFLLDILIAEINDICKELNVQISILPDKRKKPDKFHRIESSLEPINTNGLLYLNEDEKMNPSMQTLDDQFRALAQGSKSHDDGPDATEGGKYLIDAKEYKATPMVIGQRNNRANSKRF